MIPIVANLSAARKAFTDFLYSYQKSTSINELEAMYQGQLDQLDQQTEHLFQLASAGMEEALLPLLDTLLEEWAEKEAAELLLHYPKTRFHPQDPALQQTFRSNLQRYYQHLSCRVQLLFQQHAEQHASQEQQQTHEWQSLAYAATEHQQNVAQQWVQIQQEQAGQFSHIQQQWVQHVQDLSNQAQQTNQQWANIALTGVQQAQLGAQQYNTFAAQVQTNVAKMLEGSAQAQSELVHQMVKTNTRRGGCSKALGLTLLAIIAIVVIFGSAFYGASHLFLMK